MREYNSARQQLIEANQARSFDADMQLTPLEQEVDALLVSMRDEYILTSKAAGTYAPEKYFHVWDQTEIGSEQTFQFLDGLPKGGNLHSHSGSTGSVDWLLTEGLAMEGCYVCWQPSGQDCESAKKAVHKGSIAFFPEGTAPAGYFPAAQLVSQEGFTKELRSLLTSNAGLLDTDNTGAWKAFGEVFSLIGGAMAHRPLYFQYLLNTFDVHLKNGITHLEIRALVGANGLGSLTELDGTEYRESDVIKTYLEALETFKSSDPSHANFTLKIIASNSRAAAPKNVMEDLNVAIAMRREFPNFVVGFDSVSEESPIHASTLDYVEEYLKTNEILAKENLTWGWYLHDGESQDRNDTNMIDAVLLDCPRIGHGINDAFYFPEVREELKRKDTALEIAPISNQVLRYVGSLESHPGAALALDGVQIVLANDDPGVFGITGVTWDWWGATMAWHLDLRSLKKIAKNSLTYSALNETEKATAIDRWEQEWNAYMALVAQKAVTLVV